MCDRDPNVLIGLKISIGCFFDYSFSQWAKRSLSKSERTRPINFPTINFYNSISKQENVLRWHARESTSRSLLSLSKVVKKLSLWLYKPANDNKWMINKSLTSQFLWRHEILKLKINIFRSLFEFLVSMRDREGDVSRWKNMKKLAKLRFVEIEKAHQ